MEDNVLNSRIDNLEQKIDLLLEYVNQQRLKSEAYDDLLSDLYLITKDVYNTSVLELEKQSFEIDPNQIVELLFNFLKNIKTFNLVLDKLNETANDNEIPRYSMWNMIREMNKPEMKLALGFAISYIKKIAKST
ncbi:MAG: hypothetical protein PHT92_05855 [Bacteroidales bacterium]|jgi:uncharacterized protein YjgD (DUF1641 family)|nr:hypothetical protein [Bacteroidales bacterium]